MNYFLEKILNIRKLFNGIPNYKPNATDIPQLNQFSILSETQLYKIIMEMPSTTCELDIIPTEFLKKVLMHCIPTITKVVNLSLSLRHFFEDWKLAMVVTLPSSILLYELYTMVGSMCLEISYCNHYLMWLVLLLLCGHKWDSSFYENVFALMTMIK